MRNLVRAFLLGLAGAAAMAASGDQAAPPSPPSVTPSAGPTPAYPAGDVEDFIPSEKVPADDAVAFPVDI
jgi:hypothetical protein